MYVHSSASPRIATLCALLLFIGAVWAGLPGWMVVASGVFLVGNGLFAVLDHKRWRRSRKNKRKKP